MIEKRRPDLGPAGDDEVVAWWDLVVAGHLATQNRLNNAIAERFGLSLAQFDILARLLRTPGHRMPMTRLATQATLTSGGFTKIADRLTAAGLIIREPCDEDRRVVYARLTPHGMSLTRKARKAFADVLRERVIEPLGEEPAAALTTSMRLLRDLNGDQRRPSR